MRIHSVPFGKLKLGQALCIIFVIFGEKILSSFLRKLSQIQTGKKSCKGISLRSLFTNLRIAQETLMS